MNRLRRTLVVGGAGLAAGGMLRAQPARTPRIAFLSLNAAANPRGLDAFLDGLRALGYVDGKTLVIEQADAQGDLARFSALAADAVARQVDVIVAPNVAAAQAARDATRRIPVVFAGLSDPVADGLVASLARPGGNVTGLSSLAPDLVGKRLEILKQAVPRASRAAVLWQPGGGGESASHDIMIGRATAAARSLGLTLDVVEVRSAQAIGQAFPEMAKRRIDALAVVGSPMVFLERARLAELAARTRLPAIYPTSLYAEAGGLMSYGADLNDLLRRTARYVDRILKGANPADLPVEQASQFELVLNLRSARAMKLDIPSSVRSRADRVID